MKNLTKTRLNKKHETLTNGIVHAGFSGFQAFVARKKSRCKLMGNRLVIPHDNIPSTVMANPKKINTDKIRIIYRYFEKLDYLCSNKIRIKYG